MDIFKKLAVHLDNLPAGYPATESGVELRILKHLFTPEEAGIATALTMVPEKPEAIAKRLGMDESQLSPILEKMSKKGLIFRSSKGGLNHYMAAQFVVGIWEYHVNDLSEELIRDFNEYIPYFMNKSWLEIKTKQLRVIPVSKSISAEMKIMPYEEAEKIINSQSKIVVSPCICRKEHRMMGKGCDKPLEACFSFGSGAYYYEENGLGRSVSKEEAINILDTGLKTGLVLQPGNSQRPGNICMCCGCCCQILKNLNTLDAPAIAVCSNYYASVDEKSCTACGNCKELCQMNAITVEDAAGINLKRCIGCGLCIMACDFEAIKLIPKEDSEKIIPPANLFETYVNIARERGKM